MSIEGVDYSAHDPGRPGGAALKAAGISFVTVYAVDEPDWRTISREEADDIRAHGIRLVINYEADVRTWEGGAIVGVDHAQEAQRNIIRLGEDPNKPVYFSVDDDVTEEDQAAIDDYLDGTASVIGLPRAGEYGGYWAIKRSFDAGKITWGWQTYAWSGDDPDPFKRLIDPRAHIYQYNIYDQYLNGVNVDLNRALKAEYGQNPVGATPVPVPVPVPAPKPTFPIKRVAAPDQFASQGHHIQMNDSKRFFCIHGGRFHTGPSADAPTTPTPYRAGKTYTFDFRSNGTIGGARWLISRAGSWADLKNFAQAYPKG